MSVERHRLQNGMTLICEEQHEAPVVALQAWVNAGSADESHELAGVAHVHEHMLFKGTARRGVGEIARTIEAAGGEINAWTSFDQTVYHIILSANEVGLGVDVLADALRNSSFDSGELGRELEVVVEEIRRAEDSPSRRISNALFALAYGQHPYGRPVLGTEASVRGLTRERVLGFYRRHYRPDAVTMVAVGDFRAAELVRTVEAAFADWRSEESAGAAPPRPLEPPPREVRVRLLKEDVKESRVALAWPIPGLHHPDVVALDALAVILGHGESSRLFVELRRRRELVSDVYAFAYTPRDPGVLICGAGLRGTQVNDATRAILDEVYRLREQQVTGEELARAQMMIGSESAYATAIRFWR
jgi:zinc protease